MCATTWMNLKNIMLSEKRLLQKNTYSVILIRNVQNRQIYRDRNIQAAQCCGDWENLSGTQPKEAGFLFGVMERCQNCGNGRTALTTLKTTELYTFNV